MVTQEKLLILLKLKVAITKKQERLYSIIGSMY